MTTALKPADTPRLDKLSSLQLPTLPAGTPFLLESLTNEDIDFVELAAIIEKFPSIAGKLISLANSAWSAPATEVTSLEASCSRLGFRVVRSTSIALAVASPFNPSSCASFDPEYFWCSALLTADAAFKLASLSSCSNDIEPSTARAAGLLHNLSVLWLVDKLPLEVDQALIIIKNNQAESLQQALLHVLEFEQMQAGERLGRSWGLPEPLIEAMAHYPETSYRGTQKVIVSTVGLAVNLVSAILKEAPCPDKDIRLSSLGITEENLSKVFEQLKVLLVDTRAIAKVLI